MSDAKAPTQPHVVIIGGGFGGLSAARALAKAPVRVTVIDRHNHHLFQPLLYQVASANMMAEEIAVPIRSVLRRQKNAHVLLAEVVSANINTRQVTLADGEVLPYDFLVVAAGAKTNYFGNDAWSKHAIGLKNVEDAYSIRRRVLNAFEAAEREPNQAKRRELLTFTVIGGGPTGVELSGALSELSGAILARDFRNIEPKDIRVVLLEMAPRLLLAFHPNLGENARQELGKLGVEVLTGRQVTDITAHGVALDDGFLPSSLTVWAAGVTPEPLAREILGIRATARGHVLVDQDCSIAEHPEVFVVGDMAYFVPPDQKVPEGKQPRPLPGVASVAMQQGRFVADIIKRHLKGKPRRPFVYTDKGNMATIGKSRAVLEVGRLRMTGLLAWLAWIAVHVFYLIGFRNRAYVMAEWALSYVSNHRGARLIAEPIVRETKAPAHPGQIKPDDHQDEIQDKAGWNENKPVPVS